MITYLLNSSPGVFLSRKLWFFYSGPELVIIMIHGITHWFSFEIVEGT